MRHEDARHIADAAVNVAIKRAENTLIGGVMIGIGLGLLNTALLVAVLVLGP